MIEVHVVVPESSVISIALLFAVGTAVIGVIRWIIHIIT